MCGTWNVRGLTDLKAIELVLHMNKYNIDILCLQETRAAASIEYVVNGFVFILSGCDREERSWAGVGFIVAPWCKCRIQSYKQVSDRIASLKLKVPGGVAGVITAYAPHNMRPLDEKVDFYSALDRVYRRCSTNKGKLVMGDLNARLGRCQPGEEHILGDFTFGRVASHEVERPNRAMLLEFCESSSTSVANTFFDTPVEQKATYMEPGATPFGIILEGPYNLLDLVLAEENMLDRITDLRSIREATLATDHFLVICTTAWEATATGKAKKNGCKCLDSLQDGGCKEEFSEAFCQEIRTIGGERNADVMWETTKKALHAAEQRLPDRKRLPNRPWISEMTMRLIDKRADARGRNDPEEERRLHKEIRLWAKRDRTVWMEKMLADGSWHQLKKIRKPKVPKRSKLRDPSGELVESMQWADTMANYLEDIQWRIRPCGVIEGPSFGQPLPVNDGDILQDEVRTTIKKLRRRKATGPDDLPAELLQALLDNDECLKWLVSLYNECWRARRVPSEWHESVVTAIFKKGAPDQCENYRPISLLCVAYKVYASILLRRLQAAGAEGRLTSTQYGFRSGCGTGDAVFCTRRLIELAMAQKHGHVSMLALDWRRAFDSINPEILTQALRRFGVPEHVLEIVGDIYANRLFKVADGPSRSEEHSQSAGISQGCPLSPFLFIMVMTVLIDDAVRELSPEDQKLHNDGQLLALLYADDTLLVGYQEKPLQSFLDSVARVGARYGLELHWGKFQLLQVNTDKHLRRPDGTRIETQEVITYLGTTIAADGGVGSELNRRLGKAWAEYSKLSQLWKHTSLALSRKLEVFHAAIVSLLLYGLNTVWLNARQQRQLNGFQARCLRDMMRIPHPYFSRVSNKTVLERSGQTALTTELLRSQLIMFGRVARAPDDDTRRRLTFCPGSLRPTTCRHLRRVGRPRHEWASQLLDVAVRTWGSLARVEQLATHMILWEIEVKKHF